MGIQEIRNLKADKQGTKMTAAEFQKHAKGMKFPGANPMARKFKAAHYEFDNGSIYLRSLWEAHYGQYLDWLVKAKEILKWEYEPDIFFFEGIKMGTNCYKPDFKVFANDGSVSYHEVKGHMDAKSKTKLKRMKKYHPKVKVVLIERKQLAEIKKNLKGIIKFYE